MRLLRQARSTLRRAAFLRMCRLSCRCTADCGWITGHTYLTYGPLLNGAVNLVFEGVPTYPSPSRCWEIVEKYKVQYELST